MAVQVEVQVEEQVEVQVQAGQVPEPGPTGLLGLAILVLAVVVSGAVATAVLPNLAGHLGNLQAGRLENHLALVLVGKHQDTGPTGSWPGRKSTWGHD